MGRIRWNVSAGAVLLFALMYFFDDAGLVAAAVPAVLIHELGHILFLWLCGKRLTRVSIQLTGLTLDYAGTLDGVGAVLCIAGGPLFGLLYAAGAWALGSSYLRFSGGISLVLSLFNLLPVLPLDGGRILAQITGSRAACRVSRITALLLLAEGTLLLLRCHALAPLLAGIWLTICAFRA